MKFKIEIGSEEWKAIRRTKITATDIPILMGVSPWCTRRDLYYKKINALEQVQTPPMLRGIELEEPARKLFEEMMGTFVWPEFRLHPVHDWAAASFDGINDDGDAVEIKSPGKKDHEHALKGLIPEKYYPQLQWQMFVGCLQKMSYLSYNPGHKDPVALIKAQADQEYIGRCRIVAKDFHDLLVQNSITRTAYLDENI